MNAVALQIPPLSPEKWDSMDESLFVQIANSNAHALMSPEAYRAFRARASSLGLDVGRVPSIAAVQDMMRGRWYR